jgi:hypothetical protein
MTATLMLGLGRVGSIPPVWAYNPQHTMNASQRDRISYLSTLCRKSYGAGGELEHDDCGQFHLIFHLFKNSRIIE